MNACLNCSTPPADAAWSHCSTCHENFTSDTAFDEHRTGAFGVDRRCLTADEMLHSGAQKDRRGFWTTTRVGRFSSLPGRSPGVER